MYELEANDVTTYSPRNVRIMNKTLEIIFLNY